MKLTPKTILLVAALSATTGIFAESKATPEVPASDTTEITERNIGKWIITREYETKTTDGDEVKTKTKVSYDIQYSSNLAPHFPVFYMGLNEFTPARFERNFSDIPLNASKSCEWGCYPIQEAIAFDKGGHVGLTFAFGFGRAMYKFDNTCYLFTDQNRTTYFGNPGEYDVTWFRYWTLKLPIALTFERSLNKGDLFFTIGPELEYRFSGASKGRVGAQKKEIITKDLNLRPLGVNLMAQVGYDGFSLIGKASLIDLFRKPNLTSPYSTELYPVSFGIAITM